MAESGLARMSLGLVDQVLSSASNVLVVFAFARASSVDDFGAFSLALAALTTTVATGRGLLGTPIALLSGLPEQLRCEAEHALGFAVWVGVAASGLITAVAVISHAPWPTYVLALAAPFVLLQDTARFFCISAGQPTRAVWSDGLWALGSALLLLLTWIFPRHMSGAFLLSVWAGLAGLVTFVILAPLHLVPRFSGLFIWWRGSLHDRLRFGAEAMIGAMSTLIVLAVATAALGISASAALRGAGTLLGPLAILMSAITLAVVPELRRRGALSAAAIGPPLRNIAILMSVFSLALGLFALAVPRAWGELILGDSWNVVRPLLPITASEYALLAWLSAAGGGIRAQGRSSDLLRLQLVFAGSAVVLPSIAVILGGSVRMVAIALVVAAGIAAVAGWLMLFKGAIRDPTTRTGNPT